MKTFIIYFIYLKQDHGHLIKLKGATACLTILRGLYVTIKSISVALSFKINIQTFQVIVRFA